MNVMSNKQPSASTPQGKQGQLNSIFIYVPDESGALCFLFSAVSPTFYFNLYKVSHLIIIIGMPQGKTTARNTSISLNIWDNVRQFIIFSIRNVPGRYFAIGQLLLNVFHQTLEETFHQVGFYHIQSFSCR